VPPKMRLLQRLRAWLSEPASDPEVFKDGEKAAEEYPPTLQALKNARKWPLQGS
jgi:hypothetical protein